MIRLALEPGRKFTRDYLIDLLWPEAPARHASHSLAQAISVVKAKVGREHVLVQRSAVALQDGIVDADVLHLDGCDAEIGGRFLEGFEVPGAPSFDLWKDECIARLTPKVRDCLVRQMDAGRRIGDFTTVERRAEVLGDLDPLSEESVRGIMEARAWVGDRTNALKAFARYETRLAEELGAKPSPDVVRMANLLREGRRHAKPLAVGEPPPATVARFEAERIIGREREFSAVYDGWLAARRRAPQIVVVTGDPGVGKTTLANAFLSSCQMDGGVVARAQAYDAERELPFAILGELVKQLTQQRAIGSADPEALSELTRITPEIFTAFPGVPKPVEWSAEVVPLRLADAFLKVLTAASEDSPLVVVVDDIHAADNASAAILHIVARKLTNVRVLLILTARPSELRVAATPAALTSDASIEALRTVELEPLSPEASMQLIASLANGAQQSEPPTERILQASRGNPLALELLTREWAAHGAGSLLKDLEALNTQPAASVGIPRAIGTVFERQVRRLAAQTRAALDLAAVLGRRLADLSLYEAVGLSAAAAGEALSRLKEEGLLREVGGDLEFRNELIRAQAYYAVAGPARQHLHRRVGDLLLQHPTPDGELIKLAVGWHLLQGQDIAGALVAGMDGAGAALLVGAPYEAQRILEALLPTKEAQRVEHRIRLLLARALLDQSKGTTAVPVLESLITDVRLNARDMAEAACMLAAAEFLVRHESAAAYCAAADKAVVLARAAGDYELIAKALYHYAQSGAENGDEVRLRAAREELTSLGRDSAAAGTGFVHYALGYCHLFFDEPRTAVNHLERAVAILRQSNSPPDLSRAYNALAVCRGFLCEFGEAEQAFKQALAIAIRIGDDSRASLILSNYCVCAMVCGDYELAIELGLRSTQLADRALNATNPHSAYSNLAEAYLLAGKSQHALRPITRTEECVAHLQTWRARTEYLCESANRALLMGNIPLALRLTTSAEDACRGREQALTDPTLLRKLRILRTAHTQGPEAALAMAKAEAERVRERHPLAYLSFLAARGWAEGLVTGRSSDDTTRELETLFDRFGAKGRRDLLMAQGFLYPARASGETNQPGSPSLPIPLTPTVG